MSQYQLTIGGIPHLQRGVYRAALFHDCIELVFYNDEKIIKRVSLSADRTSFGRSLENTRNKIQLISQRLGIDEKDLNYSRADVPKTEKLGYLFLFLKQLIFEALIPVQWVIVFKKKGEKKWRRILPDSDVFQADPFIVFKNDKYYVFYEELKFEDYHGYLMAAELDVDKGQLSNEKVILKLDKHLSFPNIFEEGGSYYMIPECADSQRIDLYECTSFPYEWQKKQTLIDNIKAVDTTPLKTEDGWYLFTSEIVKGAACDDELSIYKSSDLFNQPFTKLYDEPVISDVNNARMAGHFIQRDGELLRVSQNCGKRYGYQANINRVLTIEDGYHEEPIESLKPDFGALGFHTYNQDHGIEIGDMEVMRFDFKSLKRIAIENIKRVLPF